MKDTAKLKSTYVVYMYCVNCHYQGSIEVDRGIDRPHRTTCPKCGCFSYI